MTIDSLAEQCVVDRSKLAAVLRGGGCPREVVASFDLDITLTSKEALVVWAPWSNRPVSIVISDDSENEFLAWLTTYHDDLVPISSWCNLFKLSDWKGLGNDGQICARLRGLEAAWVGVIIADAMIQTERNFDKLSLTSCLSTVSFPVARYIALHGYKKEGDSSFYASPLKAYPSSEIEYIQGSVKGIIYQILGALRQGNYTSKDPILNLIFEICRMLDLDGGYRQSNNNKIDDYLLNLYNLVPGQGSLKSFRGASAEDYIRIIRALKDKMIGLKQSQGLAGTFLAAFIISQLGAAERDLRLADQFDALRDDILIWSAMLGGLGTETYWSSAFAGLGRLVARELTKPFRFSDSPTCDVAYTELNFLQRSGTNSKIGIRTANLNLMSVSTQAGVSVSLYNRSTTQTIANKADEDQAKVTDIIPSPSDEVHDPHRNSLASLAKELMPFLSPLIKIEMRKINSRKNATKNQSEFKLK